MQFAIGYGVQALGDLAKQLFKLAIIIAVTLLTLSEFRDQLTAGSAEANATGDLITEVVALVGWVGVVVVITIAVILYGYTKVFDNKR